MDIIITAIQILAVVLTVGLPILAWRLWLTTDAILFVLCIVLFWLITAFVTGVSLVTWMDALPAFDCV